MSAIAAVRRLGVAVPVSTALALGVSALAAPAAHADKELKIKHAVKIAGRQVGDPYVYGATGPRSFDCSGLVYYSYRKAGLYVPRTSSQQAHYARSEGKRHMHRGDLMFFYSGSRSASNVYHVAIFLKRQHGKQMLEAPRPGRNVHRTKVWTSKWFPGTLRPRS